MSSPILHSLAALRRSGTCLPLSPLTRAVVRSPPSLSCFSTRAAGTLPRSYHRSYHAGPSPIGPSLSALQRSSLLRACPECTVAKGIRSFASAPVAFPQSSVERRSIGREDIMEMEEYGKIRKEVIDYRMHHRKDRRVFVGPCASVTFPSYEMLWTQIHEMLFIERGGEEQIADELEAYEPLLPTGKNIVITLMFEVDDKERRDALLYKLSYVEDQVKLEWEKADGTRASTLAVTASADIDRTAPDGKTSSVHFLQFKLDEDAVRAEVKKASSMWVTIDHEGYPHSAKVPAKLVHSLQDDLDQ